ncbi:unnamed protein product [Citrullus colocynthis]|uniref:Cytochrome P450 n=1 Tax=Citrullus colocynthis TaxID=252529 RepID=A0ABP0YRG3_9ROSI
MVTADEQLPPGPPRWPVVGNLLQLSFSAHESFTKLAAKYGPIMTLQLGSMKTVVISSSTAAREIFKNHDAPLSGRMIYEAMKGDHGTEGSLITSQYGPHWRMLRRLATSEFFVTRQLEATKHVRRRCIDTMIRHVEEETEVGQGGSRGNVAPLDVGKFIFIGGKFEEGKGILLPYEKSDGDGRKAECGRLFTGVTVGGSAGD